MIKRLILLAFSAATLLSSPLSAQETGEAQVMGVESLQPLAVIRFNQRNVIFEKSLSAAVSRAIALKPGVVVTAVLYPGINSTSADMNLDQVLQTIANTGLSSSQIQAQRADSSGRRYDEVRVFVQ